MPVIKRYPNRKLYDTETKQYVTLDGIAVLIREGRQVHVLDHLTGEDLTAVTLTQVIFEQEKRRRGFLPLAVLTGLIQAGGDSMGSLRRALAAPLNLARQVDEEIERRIQDLIGRGDLAAEEGHRLRDRLLAFAPRQPAALNLSEQQLEQALDRLGVPRQHHLQEILAQLETLDAKLESLSQGWNSD